MLVHLSLSLRELEAYKGNSSRCHLGLTLLLTSDMTSPLGAPSIEGRQLEIQFDRQAVEISRLTLFPALGTLSTRVLVIIERDDQINSITSGCPTTSQ